jgi:aspartate/methionine/tyrosine aminotransferase
MVREIGVAGMPGFSFFRQHRNRFVRSCFATKEETLDAAGSAY